MKPKSLMKRSAFASRRKVLLYVLTAILAVSIVGAWGVSDGIPTVPVAGERIVMWQELPDSGTPEDYDLLTNLKFASQRIYTASYFRSETNGTVVGKSAGIPITQTVRNTRVKKRDDVRGDIVFSESISTSSLVDSYEQQYSEGDIVFTRQRASGSGDDIVWEDKATHLSLAAYSERYGTIPKELSKYVIGYTTDMQNSYNTVFTVLSARDENAMAKSAANAAAAVGDNKINGEDGAEAPFDVPQTLVADENGHYTFTVELDPLNSTKYYRNEVKTRAGKSASYPTFISSSITFTIDRDWNPISVTTNEKYEISIGIAATCTSTLTEVFYQINDPDGKVPEEEFFAPRVEEVRKNLYDGSTGGNPEDKVPDSPIEYLAVAFADYFGGAKPLSLNADISAGDLTVESMKLSIDFGTMNVRVKLGALYIEYADDKVYITLNDIKGYVRKDKFTELTESGALGGIAGMLPDFSALMGDDAISKLFENCEMTSTDGITRIRLPFDLDGISVDASLYMNDKDLSLNSITGSIAAFGTDVRVTAKPVSKLPAFPASYDGYTDLSGILDFVPDAMNAALGKTYGADGTVTVNGNTFGVNAYIDRTDGIKLDADITALGQKLNIKLVNGEMFASIGNIRVRGTASELPDLLSAVSAAAGINLGTLDDILPMLKKLAPTDVGTIVGMLKSLDVSDDELSVGIGYMGIPLNLTLRRGNGMLTGLAFDIAVDMFGINASAAAELNITAPAQRDVTPDDGSYITLTQLTQILSDAAPYIAAESYSAELNGTLNTNGKTYPLAITARVNRTNGDGVAAAAEVSALGQTLNITYTDGTAYIAVGNLRFKLAADRTALDAIKPILDAAGIKLDTPDAAKLLSAALAAVKSLAVDENGAITADIAAEGITANATVNVRTGALGANINTADARLTLAGTLLPAQPEEITAPDGAYTDAAQLLPMISAALPIITDKALTAQITLDVNGTVYPAAVALSFAGGLKAKITENTFGAQITVLGTTVYVELCEIRVIGTSDDIPALTDALRPVLPQSALDAIDGLLGMLSGGIDPQNTAAQILGAIKSFTVTDGNTEILLALGETATASITLTADLSSAAVKANANGISIAADVYGIAAGCAPITAPDGDFAAASELIAAVSPVIPLAARESLAFTLGGSVLGVPVTRGEIFFDGAAKAFSLDVTLADFDAAIALVGGTVYIDANGGGASPVKISCGTSSEELKDLLHKLDYAVPGIEAKVYELLEMFKDVTVEKILGMLALSSAENGFKVTIDTRADGLDSVTALTFARTADGLDVSVSCAMATLDISAHISASVKDGAIYSVTADRAEITVTTRKDVRANDTITLLSPDAPLVLTLGNRDSAVTVGGGYVPVALISEYIAPAVDLVKQARSVRTVTLGLDAFALVSDKYTQLGGEVTLALAETTDGDGNTSLTVGGVYANLQLFKNTDSEETVEITYVDNIAYIKTGEITLRLDMSDSDSSDFIRLYKVLAEYLPEYLCDELAKLLGLKSGASMFSDISLIVERIAEIAAAQSANEIAGLLFAPLNNLAGDSAIKTLMSMISLSVASDGACDELVVSLGAMGITANVTPHIANGAIKTLGLTAGMESLGLTLGADVTLTLSPDITSVTTPANAADFVSVAEFVEAINNGIHTFMTKDEDGNITFEVTSLDFDYMSFATEKQLDEFGNPVLDENGNEITVKDEAGRDKPAVDEYGNKVVADTVKVTNKQGESAIKGKFETVYETDENGERITDLNGDYIIKDVRFCLEVHISVDIGSLAFSPLTLDLYVLKTDEYPDGIACVYYTEGNGYGERISIDYVSVMQILAAVMDIVGAKDETVEYLLGEYRLPIDTDVFDSMTIAGFDTIKNMLDGLTQAVIHVKDALADAKTALNLINTAGSVDNLRARMDDVTETETVNGTVITVVKERGIKSCLAAAAENIKAALAAFGLGKDETIDAPTTAPERDYTVLNGELFKKIVNGVRFVGTDNAIGAVIDNSITTNTDGEAAVTVTQSNGTVDSITVGGLDVNTAKLDNFDMRFTAGQPVDISLPADYSAPADAKVTYSNLADIKHLLFDVMNTANLLEFDIGGLDTSDAISITMSLGADWLANLKLNIKYNVKVKIVKVGEDSFGKPIYKTAAAVEIHNEKAQVKILNIGSKVIVPDCTTRLFFYDDVLYVQGVRSWQSSAVQRVVGTVTDITCIADRFGKKETRYPTIKNTEYLYDTTDNMDYVEVMYTVDELFWMMNSDMNKFLNEFLFYLIPITTEKIAGQDIRGLITNSIGGDSSGNKDTSGKTPAQIFKGYTYKDGKHSMTIGLAELASSSSLSDLNISLTGANDGDENILDNYISSLNVNTKIAGIISVNLDATLRNVAVSSNGTGITGKGLAPTDVTLESGKYTISGNNYVLDCYNYDRNTIYTLDGLTYLTANGNELYIENGSFASALNPTGSDEYAAWTSTVAETRYCDSVYKFGDTGATYYYTASLSGYGYRYESAVDSYYIGVNADGSRYVYRLENGVQIRMTVKSITDNALAQVIRDARGNIIAVTNRTDGIQWERPWQTAYEAAQAA